MASNAFGNIFRITTWGESHGIAIGVVIDGAPAGVMIDNTDINRALALRAPGNSPYTSPRREIDSAQIYSGVFEGKTTGAPISIIIHNHDADSSKYTTLKNILRPGHANFTYLHKYGGIFDYQGGGRASARETACRVAASVVAKKILQTAGIQTCAYIAAIGGHEAQINLTDVASIQQETYASYIYCPDIIASTKMMNALDTAIAAKDSLGGVVGFFATGLPVGLGEPIYEKLEANLAKAMLSLPASKGFEIGEGFYAATMTGSKHNDLFYKSNQLTLTTTNHAGGTLGGISTGMPLHGRVAFKPTSSIAKAMATINTHGQDISMQLPQGSRHDPCVAIRAVPVVDAMCALVLADALLMDRCARL